MTGSNTMLPTMLAVELIVNVLFDNAIIALLFIKPI